MTPTQRAAMQRALNFIREIDADDHDRDFLNDSQCNELSVCEMFLSAALAEPAPVQEWMCVGGKLYNTAQQPVQEPVACIPRGWSVKIHGNGFIGINSPMPKAGESRRTSHGIHASDSSDLAEIMRKYFAHALAQQPAPVQEPVGPSGDRLSDFSADQWWLPELDSAVANGTPDQKRAVAVVRNLLATKDVYLAQQPAPPADVPMLTPDDVEREWQFLHDEEGNSPDHHDFARAIEQLYRQKAGLP